MYRPHNQFHTYQNQRFGQRSPQLRPRVQFLQWNSMSNQFRTQGPSMLQNNYEFWCETCDKGFQTLANLDSHKLQHQKCNIDGCQFVAHPKIITKHIQMQHSTGLYKKIAKLNNPEEIKKWREERKRKYPTKQNIEKKAAEVKERLERGEKMGMKCKEYNKRHKPDLAFRRTHNFGKQNQLRYSNNKFKNQNNTKPMLPKRVCKEMPLINEPCKLKQFSGIQQIIIEENNAEEDNNEMQQNFTLIEDDIYTEDLTKNVLNCLTQSEPSVCGALSSLICNYGSSDEEESYHNNTSKNVKDSQIDLQHKKSETPKEIIKEIPVLTSNIKEKSDDDSGPEETVIKKMPTENVIGEDESQKFEIKTIDKKGGNNRSNIRVCRKPKYQLPSTLLVKLLKREIEHERNIILQCIRYVVKNNYFDTGKNKD